MRPALTCGFVAVLALLQGCATSRSEIKITNPAVAATAPDSARVVQLRNVRDARVFEDAPSDPSIPSLGFEGASKAPPETRSRAVGRKRNSYGKALGDILLEGGQTVEDMVRQHLRAALHESGFRVVDAASSASDTLVIDVDIKNFWAWFQPGFWAITLNTKLATDLQVAGSPTRTSIDVRAEESRQVATDGAWIEIIDKALAEFRKQVISKAATLK